MTGQENEQTVAFTVRAVFTEEGFPSAFYPSDIWPSGYPDNAVEISTEAWREFLTFPGARKWENGEVVEYTPPEPTPEEKREAMPNLTARQLRLGLLQLGKLADVNTAIESMPEPEKSKGKIEWDYASEFRRLHPLIVQLIPILGLTDEQVDVVWEEFSKV